MCGCLCAWKRITERVNKRESVTDPERECVRKMETDREREPERERWRFITLPDGRSGLSELEQWA